jgi:hypothetical protein
MAAALHLSQVPAFGVTIDHELAAASHCFGAVEIEISS